MRDICADLKERVRTVAQEMSAENARFESVVAQLKQELGNRQEHLRAQLRLANKVIEFIDWQARLRAELGMRIAVAEMAETFIRNRSAKSGS